LATKALRGVPTLLVGLLVVSVLFTGYTASQADAGHEPANKITATGSDVDEVFAETDQVVLSETVKISTMHDLVLSLSAECSILTELTTNNDNPSATAEGSVRMRIEIDGTPVPVASNDAAGGADDAGDDDDEIGEVTFCNRAYSRTVTDGEDDGQDDESDYIATRTANAFNWLAFDIGAIYDAPLEGQTNNEVLVEVIADYDATATESAVADAFVGSRTLIAEPTNASNHEAVEPADPAS